MVRRMLYTFNIAYLEEMESPQIFIQIILSLLMISYVISVKPYALRRDNIIEIINELTILIVFYLCLFFPRGSELSVATR